MQKLFGLTAFVAVFALSACGGVPGSGDGGGDGGGNAQADMMMDMYKNGTMKASYWAVVHADPQPGQLWETENVSNFGMEMKTKSAWQCCKREGDMCVIENDMGGYAIAYQVDLTKKDLNNDGPNVTKAWIGKTGEGAEKAVEIGVMEYKKPEGGATGEAPKYEMTEGDETVNAAGKDWACHWVKIKTADSETTTWTAAEGWFGGVVKMEMKMASGSSNSMLVKTATDCKPWLKWE